MNLSVSLSVTPWSPHEKEDMIFVEETPSLEAALPDQDADDEKEDDDDEEDRPSLDDFGWVECHWSPFNKTKRWREYDCLPRLANDVLYTKVLSVLFCISSDDMQNGKYSLQFFLNIYSAISRTNE